MLNVFHLNSSFKCDVTLNVERRILIIDCCLLIPQYSLYKNIVCACNENTLFVITENDLFYHRRNALS